VAHARRRRLLSSTLAAGVGLSACGEGGDKGGSATAKASQLNLDTLSGEITFQAQGLKGTFDGFFNDLIKKFEKEHSGCTIKWTDLPGTDDFDTTMVTQASTCRRYRAPKSRYRAGNQPSTEP
jgi:multiple sugar transport system substrate-binding protein